MVETEIELTYLASELPASLSDCEHYEVSDTYFPAMAPHPSLRIRRKGDSYTLTKKTQTIPGDASVQVEENVALTADEYEALKLGSGKSVTKTRYLYPYAGQTAEIDVFYGGLEGLVLVDFEFASAAERDAFVKPDFCGKDVTQEDMIAGGILAGKQLADMKPHLDRLGYELLDITQL